VTERRPSRVVYGVTAAVTARSFLRGQLDHLTAAGWDVRLICGERGAEDFAASEGVTATYVVPARRNPSALDPITLLALWWRLMRLRPVAVVMGTPKIGVFGVVAAWLAGVPRRTYLVHGYRAEGLAGTQRRVMRALERLACAAATDVVAVSQSLRRTMIDDGVVAPDKVVILGSGSANGVDLQRFGGAGAQQRLHARTRFKLPSEGQVVACVGRVSRDKGLTELPDVWARISTEAPDAWLLLVGALELSDPTEEEAWERLRGMQRVRYAGHVPDVEQAYWASDILMFMTRREGLGMVALEAGSCGVPTVGFAATGVVDAVIDGHTGVLVPPGEAGALTEEVIALLQDSEKSEQLGSAAAVRVAQEFAQEEVWCRWAEHLDGAAKTRTSKATLR
jgi:glycosyltransferase involved in cell wall biosynthesis